MNTRLGARARAAVVALAAGVAALVAAPAHAHVSVVDVAPSEGSTGRAPTELRVEFSDDLLAIGAVITLRDADGDLVDIGDVQFDGARTLVAPVGALAPGEYTWAYRAVAGDGHPLEASVDFTVEGAPEPSPSPSTSASAASATPSPTASQAGVGTNPEAGAGGGESAGLSWWWLAAVAAVVAAMAGLAVRARRPVR